MTRVSDKIYTRENLLYRYNSPKFTIGIKVVLTFERYVTDYAVLLPCKDSIFPFFKSSAIRRNKKRARALCSYQSKALVNH